MALRRAKWVTPASAIGAGLLIAAALPPWGWWPLAVAGIGLWGWLLIDLKWKSRLGIGALVGLTHFVVALAWVPEFTVPGYPLLVLLETGFWAIASLVARGRWAPVGLAAALTLAEAARYNSPFEGLPLAGVDLGQVGGPFLAAARLGGGYAVTLSAGLLGAAAALAVARRWGALAPAAVALLLPVAGFLAPDGRSTGNPIRAAVVQGGGPVGFRGVDTDFGEVLARHLAATGRIRPDSVDLVLWPENAITHPREANLPPEIPGVQKSPPPPLSPAEESINRSVGHAVTRLDAVMVAGVVQPSGPDRFTNAAVAFVPGGVHHSVLKKIRVPFGEYIPFRSFVDRFADLSAIPSEAVAGDRPGLLETWTGKFAVSISYEVLFAERSREGVRLGGEVILVPTNAASFLRTQVPGQELAAARLRAVETGRWLLQAAPTGYSAVVDHRGVVRQRTGISEQRVLRDVVPRRTGSTPFVVTGAWPTLGIALALAAAAGLATRRPAETSGGTPGATT